MVFRSETKAVNAHDEACAGYGSQGIVSQAIDLLALHFPATQRTTAKAGLLTRASNVISAPSPFSRVTFGGCDSALTVAGTVWVSHPIPYYPAVLTRRHHWHAGDLGCLLHCVKRLGYGAHDSLSLRIFGRIFRRRQCLQAEGMNLSGQILGQGGIYQALASDTVQAFEAL